MPDQVFDPVKGQNVPATGGQQGRAYDPEARVAVSNAPSLGAAAAAAAAKRGQAAFSPPPRMAGESTPDYQARVTKARKAFDAGQTRGSQAGALEGK